MIVRPSISWIDGESGLMIGDRFRSIPPAIMNGRAQIESRRVLRVQLDDRVEIVHGGIVIFSLKCRKSAIETDRGHIGRQQDSLIEILAGFVMLATTSQNDATEIEQFRPVRRQFQATFQIIQGPIKLFEIGARRAR